MAVTVNDLALDLRLIAEAEAELEAGHKAILTRHLGAAQALIEERAPGAPDALKDAATVAVAGYLFDRPSAPSGNRFASAWSNSGASAMLGRYVRRRAHVIPSPAGDTSVTPAPTPGGPGVDQVARDAAEAARRAANDNRTQIANNAADILANKNAAATNTGFLSTFVARVTALVEQIVPQWARQPNPPSGSAGAIADASVTTSKLADGAVTAPKIADDAVTGRKIEAEAVATGHIADDAVTGRKIPRDAITTDHIGANQVGTSEIAGQAVTEAELSAAVVAKLNAAPPAAGLGVYRGAFNLTAASVDATDVAAVGAYLTSQVAGERDGDIASAFTAAMVWLYRYQSAGGGSWVQVLSWAREGGGSARSDSDLEAFIERIVSAWAIQGNADGIPGPKTFDGLFKSEMETPIPAANARIAFDVGSAADTDVVDETDAEDTSFNISAEQAAEADAFIRVRYQIGGAQVKDRPTDVELLLQVRDTGLVIGRHNLPLGLDQTKGTAQFAVGDAGAKRWAIRVVTRGNYKGEVRITEATYHSAQSLADPAIEHVVHPIVNREAEERQTEDDRLTKEIARVEGIKAIVNGLPAATATRKGNIAWRSDREYEQTDADAFQVPATGFVQFILGNIGATGIMRAEDCMNRKQIVYAQGNHEIALNYNAARKAVVTALNTRNNKRSSLAPDLIPNQPSPGLLMLTWAPARASGHATSELADLETRVEALEDKPGGPPVPSAGRKFSGMTSTESVFQANDIGKIVIFETSRAAFGDSRAYATLDTRFGKDGDRITFLLILFGGRTTYFTIRPLLADQSVKATTTAGVLETLTTTNFQTKIITQGTDDNYILTLLKRNGTWEVHHGNV